MDNGNCTDTADANGNPSSVVYSPLFNLSTKAVHH